MKIDIIIPVYNESIRIQSLLQHCKKNGRGVIGNIIVVDGGSTDQTKQISRDAGAMVLDCPVKCRAAQMNMGAASSSSDILYFIHADTLPPVSFATDILESIDNGVEMGCYQYRFDQPSALLRFNSFFTKFYFLWCQGGDKTFFIKKALFTQLGGYNEQYVLMEEYDFLKKHMKNHKFYIIPKKAVVSARKYEKNSWLRVQLSNTFVFALFNLGVCPKKLRNLYSKLLLH